MIETPMGLPLRVSSFLNKAKLADAFLPVSLTGVHWMSF
jgi:hypothetical protein